MVTSRNLFVMLRSRCFVFITMERRAHNLSS